MIVLDTNLVSEVMRPEPAPSVVGWMTRWASADLALTAVTAAELQFGVARLPAGRRRTGLARAVHAMLTEDFAGRVLPFDVTAAGHYAEIVRRREVAGRPISIADAQIAATCLSYGAVLATRNVRDFEGTGLDLVDPWSTA